MVITNFMDAKILRVVPLIGLLGWQSLPGQVILPIVTTADSGGGSLRNTLAAANAIPLDEDVIIDFSPLQFSTAPNDAIIGLSSGQLTITRRMQWIANPGSQSVVIKNTGSSRILNIDSATSGSLVIANIRFEGGRFNATSPRGGAVNYLQSPSGVGNLQLRFIGCQFIDNLVGADDPGSRPTGADGGAIYFGGSANSSGIRSSLHLADCLFDGNRAIAAGNVVGSAVVINGASLLLERGRLENQIAMASGNSTGGALRISDPVAPCIIRDSVFIGNSAPTAGAIQLVDLTALEGNPMVLDVSGCLFVGNSSPFRAGAISINVATPGKICLFRNCTFTMNEGTTSVIEASGETRVDLQHCTISENIHNSLISSALAPLVNNSNVSFRITRSIVAGNRLSSGNQSTTISPDIRNGGSNVVSEGYNLIGSAAGLAGIFTQPGDMTGADNTNPMDPVLARLADYGGPTATMPPLPESPAVDKIPGAQAGLVPVDARGTSRPGGAQGDIGAIELPRLPFSTWNLAIPDSTRRGSLDDPDGDGLPNLLEYLFGSNPNTSSPDPVRVIQSDDGYQIQVIRSSLIRPAFFSSISFDSSDDLEGWNPAGSTPVVTPLTEGSIEHLRYLYPMNVIPGGRKFFRMSAQ